MTGKKKKRKRILGNKINSNKAPLESVPNILPSNTTVLFSLWLKLIVL